MKQIFKNSIAAAVLLASVSTTYADEKAKAALVDVIQQGGCLAAEFSQTTVDQSGELVQESQGIAYAAKPQQMHWAINQPDTQKIISDGATLWRYEEDLEQVIISSIDQGSAQLPVALLSGDAERLDAYTVASEDGNFLLTPTDEDPYFSKLTLSFGDAGLKQLVMVDSFNQVTDIAFNANGGDCSNADLYAFMPPEGIDVIYE